jgi:hypothetical protein
MTDPKEIAQSIIDEIRENGARRTYQNRTVRRIREEYGDEWTYQNHNGNLAIARSVLTALGPLKDEFVVWDRSDQSWRVVTPEQLESIREREERRAESRRREAERRAAWEAERAANP